MMSFVFLVLMSAGVAHAMTLSRSFCVKYKVTYVDAMSTLHDDYFTNLSDKLARGARVKVTRNSDAVVVFNDYATGGASGNCTSSIGLDTADTYSVQIFSDAHVDGSNTVVVRTPVTHNIWYHIALSAYSPALHGSTTVDITTGTHAAWNIAAAAGWAIHNHDGGLSGETFTFYSGMSTDNFNDNSGSPYINIQDDRHKYVVVHEMGHWMTYAANGHTVGTTLMDYGAALNGCPPGGTVPGHMLNSKEYQKAAFMEGYASFYADLAFNDRAETDCYYFHNGIDWNLDEVSNDDNLFSCELGPYSYPGASSPIDEHDYLGDYCLGSGQSNNRGTQYDWMRFFWDLTTDEGLTYVETMYIVNGSNPESWYDTGDGTGTGYPATELRNSAVTLGFDTEWDSQDNLNGVQR